ncbi:tetratricopeptide repeat protein [Salipaludibacillus keqinensis]|nr:tetratricopeptide repeat protein [Salipaludibacillus keqinensis]
MPNLRTSEKKGQVIPFMQDGGYFYKKGIEAYQDKQVDRATSYFERAIRLEPDEPVFMCQLAIVLSEEGNYEASNEWLNKIKDEVDPSMSECYFFMANNMAHLGELEAAKRYIEQYLEMDEEGEFAEDAESLLSMVSNQVDQEASFEDELNSATTDKKINFHIISLLNSGDYPEAEQEARKLIAEDPERWNVYVYLAEALMYQGQSDEAGAILRDLLLKDEPNFLAQCQMTVLLHHTKDPQASVWIENLVDVRPMNDWNSYFLARSLSFLGEYRTAFAWYDKLLKRPSFPKLPQLYHQKAVLAWHCGHSGVAKECWKKVKREDPDKKELASDCLKELEEDSRPSADMKQFLYR